MSELKPCPICGGRFQPFVDNYGKYAAYCTECGMYFGVALECGVELHDGWKAQFKNEKALTDALNRRAQPASEPKGAEIDPVINEPLTLDELRGMKWYEPVYVKFKHAIPSKVVSNLYGCLCYIGASESNYGKTWLAYRRKPEMFISVDLASGHDFTAYGRPPERSENE